MTDTIEIGFHAPALPDMTPWGVVKEPHFRERLAGMQPNYQTSHLMHDDSVAHAMTKRLNGRIRAPGDGETVAD